MSVNYNNREESLHKKARQGLEGRVALPQGNGGESRNPGKPLQNGLLAIFKDGFSNEKPQALYAKN